MKSPSEPVLQFCQATFGVLHPGMVTISDEGHISDGKSSKMCNKAGTAAA